MNRVLSGNIFEVIVPNDQKRYFQYVCKDLSLLNGDVIRVFSRSYAITASPTVEEIICDEVDCYMHTAVGAGVKFGLWTYYGRNKNVGSKEVYFRDANDYGHYPGERIVSHNWTVWKINGGKEICRHASRGILFRIYRTAVQPFFCRISNILWSL